MIGGFTGFNDNQGADWGENLLNKVATNAIRHLFTKSESVEVAVRCHPTSKLLQGSIDSFKMSGKGLVIRRDFRTEDMTFETDAVAIDFSSILQGKIALKQPTQAIAQVKLSEPDINQAFQAELVKKRLENLSLPQLTELSGGQPVSFTEISVELLPHNGIKLFAQAHLCEQVIPVSLKCNLAIAKRRKILFQNIEFQGEDISSRLIRMMTPSRLKRSRSTISLRISPKISVNC